MTTTTTLTYYNSLLAIMVSLPVEKQVLPVNEESYSFFSKELMTKARRWLKRNEMISLLYLADLCRKGQLEDLNGNRHAAGYYFNKAAKHLAAEEQTGASEMLHQLLSNIYYIQHRTADTSATGQEQLIQLSQACCNDLQQLLDDVFFSRLRVFLWLEQKKLLIKKGEAATALTDMTLLLQSFLRPAEQPELAGELPLDHAYTVYAVYNMLFVFSVLSPAYKIQFRQLRTKIADAASGNHDEFIRQYLLAEKAVTVDDHAALLDSFGKLLTAFQQQRQVYMLACCFEEVKTLLAATACENEPLLTTAFREYVKEILPSYLLDKLLPAVTVQTGINE